MVVEVQENWELGRAILEVQLAQPQEKLPHRGTLSGPVITKHDKLSAGLAFRQQQTQKSIHGVEISAKAHQAHLLIIEIDDGMISLGVSHATKGVVLPEFQICLGVHELRAELVKRSSNNARLAAIDDFPLKVGWLLLGDEPPFRAFHRLALLPMADRFDQLLHVLNSLIATLGDSTFNDVNLFRCDKHTITFSACDVCCSAEFCFWP